MQEKGQGESPAHVNVHARCKLFVQLKGHNHGKGRDPARCVLGDKAFVRVLGGLRGGIGKEAAGGGIFVGCLERTETDQARDTGPQNGRHLDRNIIELRRHDE